MGVELILGMEDVINYLNEVQAENKKLKEELLASNTALQIVKDENEVNKKNMFKFMKQNKELKEDYQKNSEASDMLEEDGKEWNGNEWVDEEELSKYEKEDSDWAFAYGFSVKDGEYRAVMAGGGDHWEDYVITRDRNFIHNKMGESIVSTFISCPEAKYIKVVHIGETYELEEGETDMYEMITDCYQKEIMEYCEEEDEEPDSP